MASFSMHLSIAKLYLDRHTEEDEYEFVRGSIEPDLAPFLEKGRTHYGLHAAWANPAKYLQENGKSLENSFKRGYFLHLLTDYLFYHLLINIDEILNIQDVKETIDLQNLDEKAKHLLDEWIKNQRNDFSVLEGEIRNRYDIEDYIKTLPENIRKVMTSIDGDLKVFKREEVFVFLENMGKINIDKIAEDLIKNPGQDLIELYRNVLNNINLDETR